MPTSNLKQRLQTLHKNLNTLKEREARYGRGDAPLSLLNQIEDHQNAIQLVEQALRGELSEKELTEQLASLNLDLAGTVQNIFTTVPRPFLIGSLSIGVVVALFLFLMTPQGQLLAPEPTPLPPPTPTPFFTTPAKPGETLILVAKFENSGKKVISMEKWIQTKLQEEIKLTNLKVRLELAPPINQEKEAREMGQVYGATIVIWGWVDDFGLAPQFLILHPAQDTLTHVYPVSAPNRWEGA